MTHKKAQTQNQPQAQLDLQAQTQPPTQQNMLVFSSILDNYLCGKVGDFLQQHIKPGATLAIVSAYFTIYAFEALKQELLAVEHVRFLYGEPRGITTIDPSRADKKVFALVDKDLKLSQSLHQKGIARECAEWIRDKVDVRSIRRSNFLHGKMYHIEHHGGEEAVVGSANFTLSGLGLGTTSNIELNLMIDSARDRRDLKRWFDELWANDNLVLDVKDDVLMYLAKLYAHNAPQFIYYKTLFHLFENYLQQQAHSDLLVEQDQFTDTGIWQALFAFQRDGVRGAINKILKHGGCIIADSVGLGKTFEALAVIRYFELRNDRVLVLCPKKLRENWTMYQAQNNSPLNPFLKERFSYTVLSHTDLSREHGKSGDIDLSAINWGNYDLVVIDESHNFRNNTRGKRDEDGNIIRKSRYERLMDDIINSGVRTKVLLLSATPVNTDLSDLRNQLAFLTGGNDGAFQSSLGVDSIQRTLAVAQRTFNEWARTESRRSLKDLLDRLSSALFTLLDELTIARSRKHIQSYYSDTIHQLGGFPQRQKPVSVVIDEVDLQGRFMSYDRLHKEISDYRLSLFNPTAYVLEAYKDRYDSVQAHHFRQSTREHFLIGMMRVNFLKRLESSVHAFAITLDRTIRKIEDLEERIKRFHAYRDANPTVDVDTLVVEDEDDPDMQAFQVGTLAIEMSHMDTERWLQDLQDDKQQLNIVHTSAKDVSVQRDAKLKRLKELIAHKIDHPTTNSHGKPNRKVLIFTAFADTARYLYTNLCLWLRDDKHVHCALVVGTGDNKTTLGKSDFMHILTNFAPLAKKRADIPSFPNDEEIDVLIATDCISEGQNLQDCDYLINYDIHWNPVRIIQRFGRIDRIGSPNTSIQLVNFWPTPDLNKYINLKNRVEARMALVDITATGEDNVLAEQLDSEVIAQELSYRDQQLMRLKDEVLDLEDLNESITLNDFTLDDFRIDLLTYIQNNRKQLEEAPLGMYAVVPPHPDYTMSTPGIIFCLRQKQAKDSTEVNPLHPYYLVYVRDTGEVRLGFVQPKQILELYRVLCANGVNPYESLCDLFDQRTQNGQDMSHETLLLQKTIQSITATFKRRMATGVFMDRKGKMLDAESQVHETTDFELMTWTVIV